MKKLLLLSACSLLLFTGCGKKYDKVTVCKRYDEENIVTVYSKGNKVYLLEAQYISTFDSLSAAIDYEEELKSSSTTGKNDPKKTLIITRNDKNVTMLLKNYAYEKSYKEWLKEYDTKESYSCTETEK
ncbi:MAG: hypothetical protein HFH09_00140 [Bacilli bacterium]|jgi:hypothetical protein|nr:hypothetical protein [Bacilli bacterium]